MMRKNTITLGFALDEVNAKIVSEIVEASYPEFRVFYDRSIQQVGNITVLCERKDGVYIKADSHRTVVAFASGVAAAVGYYREQPVVQQLSGIRLLPGQLELPLDGPRLKRRKLLG